jgi:hypothetical protein
MSNTNFISPCGNNCSTCPRYVATQENDKEKLQQIAELWFRIGFRETIVSADEMKCNGCSSDSNCKFKINNCTHRDNRNNCGECDFYPCDKISVAFENANFLKMSCKTKCTDNELFVLEKTFFNKQETLNAVYKSYCVDLYK